MGLLFAGFNTGNNLFYLIFTVMAASELVGFLVAGRALSRLAVEVQAPRRGRAHSPMRITITVKNGSRRIPAPALEWTVHGTGGASGTARTPALAPGATGTGTGLLVPARRGLLRIESAETHSDYPLGLARRVARLRGLALESLVAPRLERGRAAVSGSRRGDVRQLAHPAGFGEEPLDAREYRPGDDARRIDWKASARTERLMWRDRRGEPPRAVRVRVDRTGPPGAAFERRVSRYAGTAVAALASGRPVGLVSDEVELLPRSGPAQRRRILDYLALVQPGGAGGDHLGRKT
jgi:uncharacterized protein (DUF58 family)